MVIDVNQYNLMTYKMQPLTRLMRRQKAGMFQHVQAGFWTVDSHIMYRRRLFARCCGAWTLWLIDSGRWLGATCGVFAVHVRAWFGASKQQTSTLVYIRCIDRSLDLEDKLSCHSLTVGNGAAPVYLTLDMPFTGSYMQVGIKTQPDYFKYSKNHKKK